MGVATIPTTGVQQLGPGATPTTFGPTASNQSLSGFRKAIHTNRGRAGRLRNARASGSFNRLSNPAARAAQARAAQAASNAALRQGLTGASAGTSVLPLSGNVAAGGGSLSAMGTVGAGIVALGSGLVLGNAIYEGIGRPFGPSLGDYARRRLADMLGHTGSPSSNANTFDHAGAGETNLPPAPDDTTDPTATHALYYDWSNAKGQWSRAAKLVNPNYTIEFRSYEGWSRSHWAVWDGGAVELTRSNYDKGARIKNLNLVSPSNHGRVYPRPEPSPTPAPATAPTPVTAPSIAPAPAISPTTAPGLVSAPAPTTTPGTAPATVPSMTPDVQPSTRPGTAPSTTPSTWPGTAPLTTPTTTTSTRPGTAPSSPSQPGMSPQLPNSTTTTAVSRPVVTASFLPTVQHAPLNILKHGLTLPEPEPTINAQPTTTKTTPNRCQCTPGIASALDKVVDNKISNKLDKICQLLSVSGFSSIDLSSCDGDSHIEIWAGQSLSGIYEALESLSIGLTTIWKKIKCEPDITAATPMVWESKTPEHKQLIVLWGPTSGGSSRWAMHIPHPKSIISETYNFVFPTYKKGNTRGTLILLDNTRVVVNAASESECKKVLSYCRNLIESDYLKGSKEVFTKGIADNNFVDVKARYIKSFAGHRDQAPLWVKTL